MRHAKVDLWDVVESRRDDIAEIESNQDDLVEEAKAKYGSFDETPGPVLDTYNALEDRRLELKQMVDAAATRLEEVEEADVIEDPAPTEESGWSSTEFLLKELSIGDVAQIQDRTGVQVEGAEDAFEAGEGAAMTEALKLAVVRPPDGSPDPTDYPPPIAQMILMKVSELGGMAASEEELGKSSLRERMES